MTQDVPADLPHRPNLPHLVRPLQTIKSGARGVPAISPISSHDLERDRHRHQGKKRDYERSRSQSRNACAFERPRPSSRSRSRSRSPPRKTPTRWDSAPSTSSPHSSMSIPTGPRKGGYIRRSSSPPLPRSPPPGRRKEYRREPSPNYSRRRSQSRGRGDRDRSSYQSRPASPTTPFQSPHPTAAFESPPVSRTQSFPDPRQQDNVLVEPPRDVKTPDPRAQTFSPRTTSRHIAVVTAHLQAERCAAMLMDLGKGDSQEAAAAVPRDPRSRPSSPKPASPVVTVEVLTPTDPERTDMEVEGPQGPTQATDSLGVPPASGDDAASDDMDMDISPARPALTLLPDSSAKPFEALNVQSAGEARPPQPPSTEPTHHRLSSLPVQGSPPRLQQVRQAAAVSLSSPQVSVSPTISVGSCPSSGIFTQRKLPSEERAPPVSLTQNINALVKSISNVVRYRLDHDAITTQILNYERRLQTTPPPLAPPPPAATPNAPSSSTKPVDPRLAAIWKTQSSQSSTEDDQQLPSERKSLEAKIAKAQKDQALVQTKLSQEMARVQQHVRTFYNSARSDFVDGAARARSQSAEAKDRVEERERTLVASSTTENIGLGLQIGGGNASSVVKAESDAPAPAPCMSELDQARLDRLEADLTAQFSELTDQCRSAFTTLTDDRKEVIHDFDQRFEELNKLFVSGVEFVQYRDALEQVRKGLGAVVDVGRSRAEEAAVLSGVVKDANARIAALEGQVKAQQAALDGFVAAAPVASRPRGSSSSASSSTAAAVSPPDPQLAAQVGELEKRIDGLTTENARLQNEIDQCAGLVRSESQNHDNEVRSSRREMEALRSENQQSRTQLAETVQGYQAEMGRISNSMSVLAAIATGKPGFDYLRVHLGNIVVGTDVAIGGPSDAMAHTGPNHVLPVPLPLAVGRGGGGGGGLESRNAVKKSSGPMAADGTVPVGAGRLSGEGLVSAVHIKVED